MSEISNSNLIGISDLLLGLKSVDSQLVFCKNIRNLWGTYVNDRDRGL